MASTTLTVMAPPEATRPWSSVVVLDIRSKSTVVSDAPIEVSVAIAVAPRYSVAVPPVRRPATIVA